MALIIKTVLLKLREAGIRAEIDDRNEKIGKKIRDTELAKVPYMLVFGEKEIESNSVAVRKQGKGDQGVKDLTIFINELVTEIKERKGE